MLMYDNDYSESGSIHDWVGDNVTDIAVTDGWLSADREESFSQSLPPRVGFAWDSVRCVRDRERCAIALVRTSINQWELVECYCWI